MNSRNSYHPRLPDSVTILQKQFQAPNSRNVSKILNPPIINQDQRNATIETCKLDLIQISINYVFLNHKRHSLVIPLNENN